jgi:hypothetical protein
MDWVFDGIGTAIVSSIISMIVGGVVGYRIGVRSKVDQEQKAKNNANQIQIGNIISYGNTESRK